MRWARALFAVLLIFGFSPEAKKVAGASETVGPGTELDAVDEAGRRLRFRVDGVEPDPQDEDKALSLYALSVRGEGETSFHPYCRRDADGRALAVAVPGSWDARGAFHDDPKLVTFGCTNGAIAKCVRFGYKPWKSVAGHSLVEHHLACVRMVRADYCGDGVSRTRDGTRIDLWDEIGLQPRDEVTEKPEIFEAAWTRDGAAYLNVPRWSDTVDEIVAECPDKLRGRTSRDLALAPGEVSKRFPEARMFNARFVRDADRLQ